MDIRPIEITKETEALIQQVISKYIDTPPPLADSIKLKEESNISTMLLTYSNFAWNIAHDIDPNTSELSAGFIEEIIQFRLDQIKREIAKQGNVLDRITDISFKLDEPTGQYHFDVHLTVTKP